MTRVFTAIGLRLFLAVCVLPLWVVAQARAELPNPVLQTVFPAGGQVGTSVTVTVDGTALDGLRDIHSTIPRLTAKKTDRNHFRLTIPAGAPPGVYDLRAVGL